MIAYVRRLVALLVTYQKRIVKRVIDDSLCVDHTTTIDRNHYTPHDQYNGAMDRVLQVYLAADNTSGPSCHLRLERADTCMRVVGEATKRSKVW